MSYYQKQNIYSLLIIMITALGISYAFIFFISNEKVATGVLNAQEVTANIIDSGIVSVSGDSGVSDDLGLNQAPNTLIIENTSNTDLKIVVKINGDTGNTLNNSDLRYSTYVNDYEVISPSALGTTGILYNGVLLKGETIDLDIYLWLKSDYSGSNGTFSGSFDVTYLAADMLATDYLIRLIEIDNNLRAISEDSSLEKTATVREYRYTDSQANNYIWFNCKDGTTSGSDNCELWRIVGVFNVKGNEYQNSYQRVKLVRDENITSQSFGGTSYSSSTLNTYLNSDYYNSLTTSAKKMILTGEWNIGQTALTNTPNESYISESATKYYAKVGLLSASDIGYANGDINVSLNSANRVNNSWLAGKSFYTINSDGTNIISSDGTNLTTTSNTTSYGIKPSVYLSPTVSFIGGNGTSSKPYELSYLEIEEIYDN